MFINLKYRLVLNSSFNIIKIESVPAIYEFY
jgi:hypothetical protein